MKRRAIGGLLPAFVVACSQSAPGPPPQPEAPATVHFAPHDARYVAVSRGRQEQQLPTGVTSADFGFRVHLATRLRQASDGLGITITIDSVPEASGAGVPPSDLSRAAGTTFTGVVAENGRILDFDGGDTSVALVRQLRNAFEEFLPPIPTTPDAGPGTTWVDTAVANSNAGGIALEITSIASHELVEWTDHMGFEAMFIRTRSQYTMSGEGQQMGQSITLEGDGTREEHSYIGLDGKYLGGWAADSSSINAFVVAAGMSIPIIQIRNDSLIYQPG